jgi:hypothetical protein
MTRTTGKGKQRPLGSTIAPADRHGVALMERVIEKVRAEGFSFADAVAIDRPQPVPPQVIETLRFPNGEVPSPSLRCWLAFDGSWLAGLGWFADPARPVLMPRGLGAFAGEQHAEECASAFTALQGHLPGDFYLLPLGADSRRALYVGGHDAIGEHPVIVTSDEDGGYVGLAYPGFDVYMAELAGVLSLDFRGNYTGLHGHRDYKARLAHHVEASFAGQKYFRYAGSLRSV